MTDSSANLPHFNEQNTFSTSPTINAMALYFYFQQSTAQCSVQFSCIYAPKKQMGPKRWLLGGVDCKNNYLFTCFPVGIKVIIEKSPGGRFSWNKNSCLHSYEIFWPMKPSYTSKMFLMSMLFITELKNSASKGLFCKLIILYVHTVSVTSVMEF